MRAGYLRVDMELPGVGRIQRSADTRDPYQRSCTEATILYLFDQGRLKILRRLITTGKGSLQGLTSGMGLDEFERCSRYWPEREQFERVYFLLRRDVSELKIGRTRNLARRIDDLQQANGGGLELVGTLRGGKKEEARLHQRFGHLHLRGEWFTYTPEIAAFVVAAA